MDSDPSGLSGISDIVSLGDIGKAVDISAIEREVVGGIATSTAPPLPEKDEYAEFMNNIAKETGLSVSDLDPSFNESRGESRSESRGESRSESRGESRSEYRSESRDDHESKSSSDFPTFDSSTIPSFSGIAPTDEMSRRRQVDSFAKRHAPTFGIEKDDEEELKLSMIEDIDTYRAELNALGVDLSGIPEVTRESSFHEVSNVCTRIRYRYDRRRYSTMGEEAVRMGAVFLGKIFDGKRSWFGYKVNLKGWDREVNQKLHRNRMVTSKIVGSIMTKYKLSPFTQLVLELIPSLVLHASANSALDKDDRYIPSDKEAADALNDIKAKDW